jgi:HD-GYP domain-containing protein (c-di-GMP phosphodiesterase class II)
MTEPVTSSAADPAQQALAAYARTILFMRKYLQGQGANQPLATAEADAFIGALVELAKQHPRQALALAGLRVGEEYHVFHATNVALLSIAFGQALGLDQAQLRDLGKAGLFHDVAAWDLPENLGPQKGQLSAADQRLVTRGQLALTRAAFAEGLDESSALRLLSNLEVAVDYGVPVRDSNGRISGVTPGPGLALYSRILSTCSVFDALTTQRPPRKAYTRPAALELMWRQLRHRFDPPLLVAFSDLLLPGAASWIGPGDRHALEKA